MPVSKERPDFNTIYISARLEETLKEISRRRLTAITAPMGYGKTTAINWFLAKREKNKKAVVIRINIYAGSILTFWKRVQNAFAYAGFDLLSEYPCPPEEGEAAIFADELCRAFLSEKEYYIFLDDFHLLNEGRAGSFIVNISLCLPENVHIIVAGRDRFLMGEDIVRLGSRLYRIGAEQLMLTAGEIDEYACRCGILLDKEETEHLFRFSEGWFAAVYLDLCARKKGSAPNEDADIYDMFTSALIEPLSSSEREFIAAMSLADEFTADMAKYITKNIFAEEILFSLTEQNAFAARLSDGKTYRFHHLMRACAGKIFDRFDENRRIEYYNRYGEWYLQNGQYLQSFDAFEHGKNYSGWLKAIEKDVGIALASCSPEEVLRRLDLCPKEALENNPNAVLVLMRRLFSWGKYKEMLELKELLLSSVESGSFSDEEKGNISGECDLIMSFFCYNDIEGMSRLHQSACKKMTRPAASIKTYGSFTFGSPSVLMMFHRAPGAMKNEVESMNTAMPYYYKVTQKHGAGAEAVMEAEADFLREDFSSAGLMNTKALFEAEEKNQRYIIQCCNMLSLRIYMAKQLKDSPPNREKEKEKLIKRHDQNLFLTQDAAFDYYFALLHKPEKISPVFSQHKLGAVNILNPAKPMIMMIENQVLLAQEKYESVIARSNSLLEACSGLNYALVALHIKIQTAAAYEMLGKEQISARLLEEAAEEAIPDGIVMPFAENYEYIAPAVKRLLAGRYSEFMQRAASAGKSSKNRRKALSKEYCGSDISLKLSEKELEIARLAAERATNREIAEKLFLSEGTVKQYINKIYSKLGIEGDTRTKRRELYFLLNGKS